MMKSKSEEQNDCGCSRRTFLKNTVTGLGTVAVGSLALSLIEGCVSSDPKMMGTYDSPSSQGNGTSITVDILKTENQALETIGGALALGGNRVDRKGILLYRESETVVKAYSRECTHQQCTVGPFRDGVSSCPCHRSQFNLSGDKISGPAPRPLHQYRTSFVGNIITIKA
jgi:Rieske Fe-S protein